MIAPQMPSETGTIMTSIFVIVPVQSAFSLFTRRSLPTDHPRIQAKVAISEELPTSSGTHSHHSARLVGGGSSPMHPDYLNCVAISQHSDVCRIQGSACSSRLEKLRRG